MGSNVSFDNKKNFIFQDPALIEDPDKNQIYLQNFEYLINEKFF